MDTNLLCKIILGGTKNMLKNLMKDTFTDKYFNQYSNETILYNSVFHTKSLFFMFM